MDAMDPADVLEAAADALFVHGRGKGLGVDDDGRMCALGAMRSVQGLDPNEWPLEACAPAGKALARHLASMGDEYLDGLYLDGQPHPHRPTIAESGGFPVFSWNDRIPTTPEGDAHVIDTMRLCAKDLRNEATA